MYLFEHDDTTLFSCLLITALYHTQNPQSPKTRLHDQTEHKLTDKAEKLENRHNRESLSFSLIT